VSSLSRTYLLVKFSSELESFYGKLRLRFIYQNPLSPILAFNGSLLSWLWIVFGFILVQCFLRFFAGDLVTFPTSTLPCSPLITADALRLFVSLASYLFFALSHVPMTPGLPSFLNLPFTAPRGSRKRQDFTCSSCLNGRSFLLSVRNSFQLWVRIKPPRPGALRGRYTLYCVGELAQRLRLLRLVLFCILFYIEYCRI
jgi:hypothetical protein